MVWVKHLHWILAHCFFFFGGICECIRTTSFVAMRKGNRNASDFLGSFNGFTNL